MKKLIVVVLILVFCFSFVGCGKSEEVINVENSINSLTAESDYKSINDTYLLYSSLSAENKEKVENSNILSEYINFSGHFVLTEDMLTEVSEYYEDDKRFDRALISLDKELTFAKNAYDYAADWQEIGNYEWASSEGEKKDEYTYVRYGKVEVIDKYGNKSIHNFEMNSYAIFDETENNYKLVHSATIEK